MADPGIGRGRGGGGGGGAPARVWQGVGRSSRRDRPGEGAGGGTAPAQLGCVGERCKLPHRGLGRSPRSQRFLRRKAPQKCAKTALKIEAGERQIKSSASIYSMRRCIAVDSTCTELV